MCGHVWHRVNDVKVCKKCGLTVSNEKEIMFDRGLQDTLNKKQKSKMRKIKKCGKG